MAPPLVSARGIVKRFAGNADPALDNVDLTVEAGSVTGLIGPDGAGKTTLIRIVAGLIAPDGGEVLVLGVPAREADRNRIGYMPQSFGLYDNLSVDENLELYASLRGIEPRRRAGRIDEVLDIVGLTYARERWAGKLSGGMRQKLNLACNILHEPDLLLLDEPAVGLDPVSRGEILALLYRFRDQGMGILCSTAYLDEAERCDRVSLLRDGRPLFDGPPAEISRPMEGRIFTMTVDESRRREALRGAVVEPEVIDGMLHSSGMRLAFRQDVSQTAVDALATKLGASAVPAKPRFEDGFIDQVGGAVWAEAAIVRAYRDVPVAGAAPAIEAVGLTRRYGDFTAARNISFTVPRGEVFGLLGPNGAGKSTIFKMLCGLVSPSEGTSRIDGHDLARAGPRVRQALGYMPQKFSLYGDFSVRQNLDYFAGCYGLAGRHARETVEQAIGSFHLEAILNATAGTLPLGFKQRLALACALLHEPTILFLDEPTSGVDPILRREFWAHIGGLVQKGVAVLVTTHFMEEAEYCDRVAIIHHAEQIATATPDALKRLAGCPDGTMEEAFIGLIRADDAEHELA